jgi:hypothetical protein
LSGREFSPALPLALIHPAFMVTIVVMFMVILATIMFVITLTIYQALPRLSLCHRRYPDL